MEFSTIQQVEHTEVVKISNVLYTGIVHVTGGRNGAAQSNDGKLDISLTPPGAKGNGTNPEQLLAAGWSACFIGAMQFNAAKLGISLPQNVSADTSIDLATNEDGFFLQAKLKINLPGLATDDARKIVEMAHQTCPYSKATRGNINMQISVSV
ncbi:organic hydroperoxide resistance protein [Chryseobacterium indologenes]|uniref:organic hydroperoxide resistance protein n=1 Tax=Chryseobacterium indologenes TaxID=253 RepID=UPI000F4E0A1A|nr:organic hydroperoxide resistance protein [Chryseobacterium indologenes]AYZ35943.1 organic hydroperoxide resistance protein [Chryseobacterium indologenes]MBF6644728.1 organic hydroperoxide resistance protein [Chryseobacterium indologenes]MBU3047313.1 organic hydroperoxide resistance protein [Chryseobacterium indologenes]MEB4759722.1 organic hydroperoxide resistance protein [Chryseobacterium indologenes]QQQ71580.1 organic hydroperoxide resistance protein [Chryseobacterium indologenes]